LNTPLRDDERTALSEWTISEFDVRTHIETLLALYQTPVTRTPRAAHASHLPDELAIQDSQTVSDARYSQMVGDTHMELVVQIARRQAAAFVRRVEDREALASEAASRAWELRDRYDPTRGPLERWLFGIVRTVAREWLRDEGRTLALSRRLQAAGRNRQVDVEIQPDFDKLHLAFARLDERQQLVLYLRYWRDLPYRDIARRLGLSEAACRQVSRRALLRLGRMLG
jgi:RNA polymerase sigma factor (sigma-70 family)